MKKIVTFLFQCLLIYNGCFSQDQGSDIFTKKIEELENRFRDRGLKNLDPIEGIYFFDETQDWQFGKNSSLTSKVTFSRCITIQKISTNFFWVSNYNDSIQDFKGNGFVIDKNENRYWLRWSEKKIDTTENQIKSSDDDILMTYIRRFGGDNKIIYYFKNGKKIFPNKSEDNIFKTGTGFFISKEGYIITNFHVIQHASTVYISNEIYKRVNAEVVATDETNDIALLKANINVKIIPYNILSIKKEIGDNVFTLGYPFIQSMGREVKLTNGIINSNSGFEQDPRYYQFSAEVQPGNSGGPLFDSQGNVVGLVSAKHSQATNAGYALKSNFVFDFIKMHEPKLLKLNINSLKSLSLSSKYKVLKNYILLLEIE